ncbi:MAG TPA: tetratricopeptide repeat protein [Anaeromyxobacter sp.]|nr:tetratricopeptide repeat protein [Anaeromyxobacter sp.]
MKPDRKKAEALKDRGNARMQAGEIEQAIPLYREAIAADPGYPNAYSKSAA